jgi:hypothetical protein
MITERDMRTLCAIARYYVLSRAHIQRLCFPNDKTGRSTRRRLQALVRAELINRAPAPVFNTGGGSPWPAYYPSQRGLEFLAAHFDDDRLLKIPSRVPLPLQLLHWLAVADTHIALDQAIAAQNAVRLEGWINEWHTVNQDETKPERRYRLYTLIRERPRLICAPDAAFLLEVDELSKVFYLEEDRATSGIRQIAARKTPGYAELAKRNLHKRHFPRATVPGLTVLLITLTASRRDALRKAFRNKLGADLWKFAVKSDITPESFLHEPLFFPCEGDPVPLVKRVVDTPIDETASPPLACTK